MSAAFIIDGSLTMTWCFAEEATIESSKLQDRLERESALVPPHWFLEVTNVLAMAEKLKRIKPAKSAEFLSLLESLDIEVDGEPPARAFAQLLPLCRSHALTSYDAAYLELALRRRLPLATLDDGLRRGAIALGVEVLGQ